MTRIFGVSMETVFWRHFGVVLLKPQACSHGEVLVFTLVILNAGTCYNLTEKRLSEVGFEPTPTEVDCDLNAAP